MVGEKDHLFLESSQTFPAPLSGWSNTKAKIMKKKKKKTFRIVAVGACSDGLDF